MSHLAQLEQVKVKLQKALAHLEYSYHKIQTLPQQMDQLDEESLETWESFIARFSRVADLFLSRFIRTKILIEDPGFRGSFRDHLNYAAKIGIIDDVEQWMAIRELRNITVHEYAEDNLTPIFKQVQKECSYLLQLKTLI